MLSSLGFLFVLAVVMSESNTNVDGDISDEQRKDAAMVVPRDTRFSSEGSQDPSMALQVPAPFARMLVSGCKTWDYHPARSHPHRGKGHSSGDRGGDVGVLHSGVAQRDGDDLRP